MSNPVSVKWFNSTMAGAPALSGQAGALVGVLDACLINGFGSITLDSLVVSGGVATATRGAGHGFLDHAVLLIAGATPAGLNGDKRIAVVSSSVFTFDATGISDQTATGTIAAKVSPVGWTKPYSGTNKAAYARADGAATAMLLRVDDTPAQFPTLIMYESMTGVDTGSGPTPTSASLWAGKSSTANSTARPWRLFADGCALYVFINADGTNWPAAFFFGDLVSYKAGDAYHCGLIAHDYAAYNATNVYALNTETGAWIARSYSQTGGPVGMRRYTHGKLSALGWGGQAYPAPADNAFHAWPVEAWGSTTWARGLMPGLYSPIHNADPPDGTSISSVPQLPGRMLMVQQTLNSNYRAAFDLTGPWR